MRLSPSFVTIAYKLFAETAFWVLTAGALFFIAEAALPGFVSSRINFSTFYSLITLSVLPLILLRSFLPASQAAETVTFRTRPLLLLSLAFTLLLISDTHGLSLSVSIILLSTVFLVTFFLLSFFFTDHDKKSTS